MVELICTAWNNGKYHATGAGYGIKINRKDRDAYFRREWATVVLQLPKSVSATNVNVAKSSFWNGCRELINKDIGAWLIQEGKSKWPENHPPKIKLLLISDGVFEVFPGWT